VTTIERGASVDGVPSLDDPFERLLADNWLGLVRAWALLLRNSAQAEDVVQDAVIACLRQRAHITDPEQALGYVRRAVVNTARSALRRQRVALAHRPVAMPHGAGADEAAIARLERDAVVRALKTLPKRQREAVVLRFYADASERQAAAAMGVSVGAVKGYTSRGLAALHEKLDDLS
jgi:RNA polymerase sigma-70 factor (sigma-E family)